MSTHVAFNTTSGDGRALTSITVDEPLSEVAQAPRGGGWAEVTYNDARTVINGANVAYVRETN